MFVYTRVSFSYPVALLLRFSHVHLLFRVYTHSVAVFYLSLHDHELQEFWVIEATVPNGTTGVGYARLDSTMSTYRLLTQWTSVDEFAASCK